MHNFYRYILDYSKSYLAYFPFVYDGTFQDALSEFVQSDYTFNLWESVWSAVDLKNGERTRRIAHLTPIENVTIDDVFTFAEQKRG